MTRDKARKIAGGIAKRRATTAGSSFGKSLCVYRRPWLSTIGLPVGSVIISNIVRALHAAALGVTTPRLVDLGIDDVDFVSHRKLLDVKSKVVLMQISSVEDW